IVVADFNHDGHIDMAAGNYFGDSVTVLLTEPTQTASTAATAIAPVTPGQHLISANYSGASLYSASASSTTLLWGQPPATTTSLAITSGGVPVTSVPPGSVVTLTATVKVGALPLTTGIVNFCDASAMDCIASHLVGSAALTAGGIASFKFIPGPGQHSYKAVFAENVSGVTSTSVPSALTVTPLPHAKGSTTTTIVPAGSVGNYTL